MLFIPLFLLAWPGLTGEKLLESTGGPQASRAVESGAVTVDWQQFETLARDYLTQHLGHAVPGELRRERMFDEQPLEGEGRTALFSCILSLPSAILARGVQPRPDFYVAVGATEPGLFPTYDLGVDDAYSLHVGTRFMVVMQAARLEPSDEPPDARARLHSFVRECAPEGRIGAEELAVLFGVDERLFAVYRLTINGDPVYCMGADCPPGFYRMTQHPPQIALHLHLGKLIRNEARLERQS
jgi:hypothetical protein